MFEKLRKAFGARPGTATPAPPAPTPAAAPSPPYSPYADDHTNFFYNLMFCDDPAALQANLHAESAPWVAILYGPTQDPTRVAELAADPSTESRVRVLAFNWLRAHGEAVPKGLVLGAVFEVPLDGGLDTLAAYDDGTVRYANQSGKLGIVEPGGLPDANAQAKQLVDLSRSVVAQIGPWDKPRPPPPAKPNVRLNFLVSDGLYFGQGPFEVMQRDPAAGPLLAQAAQLLKVVTDAAISGQRDPG